MRKHHRLEVLAPAGSFDSMKAAVAAGADAVYMGGTRFGARAYADNPDQDGMLRAIDYMHIHGRKLYMTVNTLFKEKELEELYSYLLPYYREGLDAVIVQDLGALALIRDEFPGLDIHASTQMTLTGAEGAALLKDLGASRVVPARELSLEEIGRIDRQVDIEIECFVHGALCYCYSGQCLMSSLIGGRSGNRGRCAQPCRLPYEVRKDGERLNRKNQQYVLSLKDLCTLDLLPRLHQAGIDSLKIEGRMKSPRYTAGVTSIYRKYVDLYLERGEGTYKVNPEDRQMLLDLFDRGGFTDGYYTRHNGREMAALKEKPGFRQGNQKLFAYLDQTYVNQEPREQIEGKAWLEPGKPARLQLRLAGEDRAVEVFGKAPEEARNQPMTQEKILRQLNKTGGTPFVFQDLQVQVSGSLFMPVQDLNELRRLGIEALEKEILDRNRPGKKRTVQNAEPKRFADSGKGEDPQKEWLLYLSLEEPGQLEPALRAGQAAGIYVDAAGFGPETWKKTVQACEARKVRCLLAMPYVFREQGRTFFEQHWEDVKAAGFRGLLVRSLDEISWLLNKTCQIPVILDAGVYCWNSKAAQVLARLGVCRQTLPWELNSRELEAAARALKDLGTDQELVVYGRIPMMVSAQCIQRTTAGCTGKPGILELKDRTGALLPVKNNCRFCYNTIYNPSPLSLLGEEPAVWALGPQVLRLNFTTEGPKEIGQVIQAFAQEFLEKVPADQPVKDFTRGHFKRGVQ